MPQDYLRGLFNFGFPGTKFGSPEEEEAVRRAKGISPPVGPEVPQFIGPKAPPDYLESALSKAESIGPAGYAPGYLDRGLAKAESIGPTHGTALEAIKGLFSPKLNDFGTIMRGLFPEGPPKGEFLAENRTIGDLFNNLGINPADPANFDLGAGPLLKGVKLSHGTPKTAKVLKEGFKPAKYDTADLFGRMTNIAPIEHELKDTYANEYALGQAKHLSAATRPDATPGNIPLEVNAKNVIDLYKPDTEDYARLYSVLNSGEKEDLKSLFRANYRGEGYDSSTSYHFLKQLDRLPLDELKKTGLDAIIYSDGGRRSVAVPDPYHLISSITKEPINPPPGQLAARFNPVELPGNTTWLKDFKPTGIKSNDASKFPAGIFAKHGVHNIDDIAGLSNKSIMDLADEFAIDPFTHDVPETLEALKIEFKKASPSYSKISSKPPKEDYSSDFYSDEVIKNTLESYGITTSVDIYKIGNDSEKYKEILEGLGATSYENLTPKKLQEYVLDYYDTSTIGKPLSGNPIPKNVVKTKGSAAPVTKVSEAPELTRPILSDELFSRHGMSGIDSLKNMPINEVNKLAHVLMIDPKAKDLKQEIWKEYIKVFPDSKYISNPWVYKGETYRGYPAGKTQHIAGSKTVPPEGAYKGHVYKPHITIPKGSVNLPKGSVNLPKGKPKGKEVYPGFYEVKPAGGTHGAKVVKDNKGNVKVWKPYDQPFIAYGSNLASSLSSKLNGLKTPIETILNSGKATFQPHIEDLKTLRDLYGNNENALKELDLGGQIGDIQREHVVDWLMGNHDAHSGQFGISNTSSHVIPIDKGQSFKHYGYDILAPEYHPNASYGEEEPIYNTMMRLSKQGKLNLDFGPVYDAINQITKEVNNPWFQHHFNYFLEKKFPNGGKARTDFIDQFNQRKDNLLKDFKALYGID